MKKLFVLFAFILLTSGTLFAQIRSGTSAWISAKSAALKSSTWFFAGTNGTLNLGDRVSVLQVNGNWAEVRSAANSSLSGWTSVSNLSPRQIVATGTGASASEIAMAGKGFNQEIEDSYKGSGGYNYADVDNTEAIMISQDDLYNFVSEGRLVTGE